MAKKTVEQLAKTDSNPKKKPLTKSAKAALKRKPKAK